MQCRAKKCDYKLTKCTVTHLFFQLKYFMYSDHLTFYINVLNFLWGLQTSFDISWMIRRQTSQFSITIDKSIRKKQKQQNIQRFFNVTASFNCCIFIMNCIFFKDDSLLRILRLPGYFETRYFDLFSICVGTSK